MRTSIKLDPSTAAKLKEYSAQTRRSAHWHMREAIRVYLDGADGRVVPAIAPSAIPLDTPIAMTTARHYTTEELASVGMSSAAPKGDECPE
jgi:hypothetical protein